MHVKIDDKTYIPLWTAVAGFIFTGGLLIQGTFYIGGVDARLERIEARLGIVAGVDPCPIETDEEEETDYAMVGR